MQKPILIIYDLQLVDNLISTIYAINHLPN